MNREDVIRWARGAGFDVYDTNGVIYATSECTVELERFAALVASAEREACAKLCDERFSYWKKNGIRRSEAEDCAYAIRARGNP